VGEGEEMTDKIIELPNIERDNLLAKLEEIKRNLPHILEYSKITAELRWNQYQAYIAQGFSEQQALFLISK
jgi:hypothetical protein